VAHDRALPSIARVVSGMATIGLAIARRRVRLAPVRADQAAPALARAPQADPLLHLHRRHPSLLILVFFLFAGSLLFVNVSAYSSRTATTASSRTRALSAQAAATEIDRDPSSAFETVQRVHRIRSQTYPNFSIAYLPRPVGR
jgi:hypothetical protein